MAEDVVQGWLDVAVEPIRVLDVNRSQAFAQRLPQRKVGDGAECMLHIQIAGAVEARQRPRATSAIGVLLIGPVCLSSVAGGSV